MLGSIAFMSVVYAIVGEINLLFLSGCLDHLGLHLSRLLLDGRIVEFAHGPKPFTRVRQLGGAHSAPADQQLTPHRGFLALFTHL